MFNDVVSHIQKNPHESFAVMKEKIEHLEVSYYTYKFKILLDFDENAETLTSDFFKILKIKAAQAQDFVPNILSCKVISQVPSGFMRKIEQKTGSQIDEITERVLISDQQKSILFIQETVTSVGRLVAINQIEKEENKCYLVGKYFFEILKEGGSQKAMNAIETIFNESLAILKTNLFDFYKKHDFIKEYEQIYKNIFKK